MEAEDNGTGPGIDIRIEQLSPGQSQGLSPDPVVHLHVADVHVVRGLPEDLFCLFLTSRIDPSLQY